MTPRAFYITRGARPSGLTRAVPREGATAAMHAGTFVLALTTIFPLRTPALVCCAGVQAAAWTFYVCERVRSGIGGIRGVKGKRKRDSPGILRSGESDGRRRALDGRRRDKRRWHHYISEGACHLLCISVEPNPCHDDVCGHVRDPVRRRQR